MQRNDSINSNTSYTYTKFSGIMLKGFLIILLAVSFSVSLFSTSAFAEPSIEVNVSSDTIKSLDTIVVSGVISGVVDYKPLKITVKDPNGNVVYSPLVPIGEDGEYRRVLQPTLPSFETGTYTVIVSHEDTEITAQTQFTVIAQEIPRSSIEIPPQEESITNEPISSSKITMSADAINGSDTIIIKGDTSIRDSDITFIATSPSGNVVTISQITPDLSGNFEIEVKTGGPMWKQDGVYQITANQGNASEHKQTINVEIKDGLVIPEFGVIAVLILSISIFAIIIVSTKSRLALTPRY